MLSLLIILVIIVQHFVFDWLLQPRWMANNKSTNVAALLRHTGIVAIGLAIVPLVAQTDYLNSILFVYANWATHLAIDAATSGITSRYYKECREKAMLNTIAIDQMLHLTILFATAWWLI